jgi:serine/threonine protein kinase
LEDDLILKEKRKEKIKLSINDLEKTDLLGSGVSGEVFLLRHKEQQKKFLALKVIRFKNDEKLKNLIETEVKVLHECRSDNVIRCYASYFSEGAINIVLEFMDKGSLADAFKKTKKIPEEILGAIAHQILKGLEYLQKVKKIVHRDIKPCNVLLNSKGFAKISDFGVSGVMKNSLDSKQTLVGTYIYMSPERIEAQQYSFNSDVWSMAVSILECALGYYPYIMYNDYNQLSDIWCLNSIIKNNPSPLPGDDFSEEFNDFISKCLVKDPEKRPCASTLLSHPFILLYEKESNAKLAKWLTEIN